MIQGKRMLYSISVGCSGIGKWSRLPGKNPLDPKETVYNDGFAFKHKWLASPNVVSAQIAGNSLILLHENHSISIWDIERFLKPKFFLRKIDC